MNTPGLEILKMEARVLSQYLIGATPASEFLDRYVAANIQILTEVQLQSDTKMLNLAINHPVLLGPLDAAIAFSRFPCLLRNKLLIMAAILEASPRFADSFLPEVVSKWRLGLSMFHLAIRSGLYILLGLPLLAWFRSHE